MVICTCLRGIAYDAADMIDNYGDFKLLPPDPDPDETTDWVASLDALIESVGRDRAQFVLYKLLKRARQTNIGLPPLTQTRYINTISPEQEAPFPGDEPMEHRIRRMVRWNAAAMVLRANNKSPGIGGHLATYASAAGLYEVGFNHFFRGKSAAGMGDQVYYQGHAAPGIYARAFLEGRLSEDQLDHFRQEVVPGPGPARRTRIRDSCRTSGSSPRCRWASRRWRPSTRHASTDTCCTAASRTPPPAASGPSSATVRPTSRSRWDRSASPRVRGWTTSPSWSTATCSVSMVRCAATARSSRSSSRSSAVPAGTSSRSSGAASGTSYWRATPTARWCIAWARSSTASSRSTRSNRAPTRVDHFFGTDARLLALVEHLSDDQIKSLRRGGHDYRKLYAAYRAAVEHEGAPTVILTHTVKGWTLGQSVEARNITHQAKKMSEQELRFFRDRLELPIPDDKLKDAPYYRPPANSPEIEYLQERRAALGGPSPHRVVISKPLEIPGDDAFGEFDTGSGTQEASTTMVFAKLLRNLLRDEGIGKRIVPIIPDEARTFGMDPLFKEVGIYSALGQLYEPVDSNLVLSYREATDGQVLEEGLTEAGSTASMQAAGTAYATHAEPMIPFYIFYSMFGFQRTGDELWAFGDARGRGFMLGATAGRTTLNGEGLQHEDGHSLVQASMYPTCRVYDPAFAFETAAIIKDGIGRMYGEDPQDVFYYVALYNENHVMPPRPDGVTDADIVRGLYRFQAAPTVGKGAPKATILASGVIMQQAIAAQDMLAERFGVEADIYSAPSFQLLRNEALEVDHWNMRNPAAQQRVPEVTRILAEPAGAGPVIAVSDWIRAWPDMISRWVPTQAWRSLGTDGFGRSDTRANLRDFFGIDAPHIVVAVMSELAGIGAIPAERAAAVVSQLGLDPDESFALGR